MRKFLSKVGSLIFWAESSRTGQSGDSKQWITEFDIVYLLDATGSMGSYLEAAREQCINISNQLKSELPQFDFNFGAVFYRDPVDCPGEEIIHIL